MAVNREMLLTLKPGVERELKIDSFQHNLAGLWGRPQATPRQASLPLRSPARDFRSSGSGLKQTSGVRANLGISAGNCRLHRSEWETVEIIGFGQK